MQKKTHTVGPFTLTIESANHRMHAAGESLAEAVELALTVPAAYRAAAVENLVKAHAQSFGWKVEKHAPTTYRLSVLAAA